MITEMHTKEINLLDNKIKRMEEDNQILLDQLDLLVDKIDEQSKMIADYESLVEKLKEYLETMQPRKVLYKAVNVSDKD